MICPNCKRGALRVTHVYVTPNGKTQRRECNACLTTATTQIILVNMDPCRGEGARALAKRLQQPT